MDEEGISANHQGGRRPHNGRVEQNQFFHQAHLRLEPSIPDEELNLLGSRELNTSLGTGPPGVPQYQYTRILYKDAPQTTTSYACKLEYRRLPGGSGAFRSGASSEELLSVHLLELRP